MVLKRSEATASAEEVTYSGPPGLSLEELTDFLSDRLSGGKIPRHLLVLEDLPQTPIGKVDRKALLAMMGG